MQLDWQNFFHFSKWDKITPSKWANALKFLHIFFLLENQKFLLLLWDAENDGQLEFWKKVSTNHITYVIELSVQPRKTIKKLERLLFGQFLTRESWVTIHVRRGSVKNVEIAFFLIVKIEDKMKFITEFTKLVTSQMSQQLSNNF